MFRRKGIYTFLYKIKEREDILLIYNFYVFNVRTSKLSFESLRSYDEVSVDWLTLRLTFFHWLRINKLLASLFFSFCLFVRSQLVVDNIAYSPQQVLFLKRSYYLNICLTLSVCGGCCLEISREIT